MFLICSCHWSGSNFTHGIRKPSRCSIKCEWCGGRKVNLSWNPDLAYWKGYCLVNSEYCVLVALSSDQSFFRLLSMQLWQICYFTAYPPLFQLTLISTGHQRIFCNKMDTTRSTCRRKDHKRDKTEENGKNHFNTITYSNRTNNKYETWNPV